MIFKVDRYNFALINNQTWEKCSVLLEKKSKKPKLLALTFACSPPLIAEYFIRLLLCYVSKLGCCSCLSNLRQYLFTEHMGGSKVVVKPQNKTDKINVSRWIWNDFDQKAALFSLKLSLGISMVRQREHMGSNKRVYAVNIIDEINVSRLGCKNCDRRLLGPFLIKPLSIVIFMVR